MATRPNQKAAWCTANPAGRVQPPTSLVESGWAPGATIAAEHINFLFGTAGDFISYLDSQSGSLQLASTLDTSCRLIGGGSLSWSMSTRVLAWDAPLFVAIPSQADSANAIAPGSVAIPDGSVGYVTANVPFSTTASTTTGSPVLSSVLYSDLVKVGMSVAGAGIPANASVQSVDPSSQTVTLSAPATASASGIAITFTSSGALSIKVAASATFVPGANDIVVARSTSSSCHVGINASTLRLHDKETKQLGEDAYLSITRPTAGAALTAGQAVYLSQGANDTDASGASTGRTLGQVYPADASANFKGRAAVAGFVASDTAAGAAAHLVSQGIVSAQSGLTPGAVYFLSATSPGAITLTAPTASGTTVVPVGVALSTSRLLINPAAAAQSRGQDLSLSGTLSASSVVSAKGFGQQVDMGALYVPGNTSFPATPGGGQTTYTPVPLRRTYGIIGSNSANTARRIWCPGKAGSILNVQFWLSAAPGAPLLVSLRLLRNQSTEIELAQFSLTAFPAGDQYGCFFPIDKGTRSFGQFDQLAVNVSLPNTRAADLIIQCDMTVEMAS